MNSKKIGRMTLLKHCLISATLILSIPIIAELIQSRSIDVIRATQEAFKIGTLDTMDVIFLLPHLTILLIGIWIFGGKLGSSIIDKRKPKFTAAFLAIFKLWVLHIISATILQVFRDGLPRFGWFIGGLFLILIVGIAHGLVDGHFVSREVEKKGKVSVK
ncbi:MAG: hypothetical protein HRT58_12365 [Crocinitomicaceae bacterium]|nr:hypothetical protein [Flavobacteriales bacterium]NQZ36456.1 hypothetical protein [Crocinitomicaceae bacterium]